MSRMDSISAAAGPQTVECAAVRAALRAHVERARSAEDPSAVHGLRVTCARLEVFLRLARWSVLRGDLRWLRRAASSVRDLDVLLEGESTAPARTEFVDTLQRARETARVEFRSTLEHERCQALLEALENTPQVSVRAARPPFERLVERVRERGEQLTHAPQEFERFHALRRALRRLRYAREWLELDCAAIRALQDELGALNDALVLEAWVERARGAPPDASRAAASPPSERVQSLSAAALRAWRHARREILEIPA